MRLGSRTRMSPRTDVNNAGGTRVVLPAPGGASITRFGACANDVMTPGRIRSTGISSDPEDPSGIRVVHFAQDLIGQTEAVDAPAALRRNACRCVVEVLVLGFEKAVVDLVQLVAEHLLRILVAVRNGVGPE